MDVYLFCTTPLKDIKGLIERNTGVKIKGVINSVDKITSEHAMILFVDDGNIPLDFNFRPEDVVLVEDYMPFSYWLGFYTQNVKVICYKDGFNSLMEHFSLYGVVESEKVKSSKRGLLNKKSEIKELTKLKQSRIISLYSVRPYDLSGVAFNMANIIKKSDPNLSVAVLDLDFQYSTLGYMVLKDKTKDNTLINLNDAYLDRYKVQVHKNNLNGIFLITREYSGFEIEIPAEIYVDLLYSIMKHFNIIILNLPNVFNKTLLDILTVSTDLFFYEGNNPNDVNISKEFIKDVLEDLNLPCKIVPFGKESFDVHIGDIPSGVIYWEPKSECYKDMISIVNEYIVSSSVNKTTTKSKKRFKFSNLF